MKPIEFHFTEVGHINFHRNPVQPGDAARS
jgi:hypothetical protein